MPTNEEQNLSAKYDQLYRFDPYAAGVKLAQVKGWPTDRYQALAYLARPGETLAGNRRWPRRSAAGISLSV